MKLKEIKDYCGETVYKRDRDHSNVIYYLIKNGFAGKPLHQIDKGDIDTMYYNLCINSEIVHNKNIDDYNKEHLIERIGKIRYNKIKRNDKSFLVLSYYDANAVMKNSVFLFKYGYDVLSAK